jgi:hypothetical protein
MGLPHIKPFDSKGKNRIAQIFSKLGFSTVFILFVPRFVEIPYFFAGLLDNFSALHTNCGKACEEAQRQRAKRLISKGIVALA